VDGSNEIKDIYLKAGSEIPNTAFRRIDSMQKQSCKRLILKCFMLDVTVP
jgi:hypothetical protein